jgi:mannose-6-phosphate isomerase
LATQTNPNRAAEPASAPDQFATLAPFRIEPSFVPRIWGRKTLRPWFAVDAPENPIGEVWLTGDDCLVATGPAAGQTLATLAESSPHALLGHHLEHRLESDEQSASASSNAALGPSNKDASSNSPILIKLIFADQKLSVQVHPDDALAKSQGFPRGKTECWYVLDAEPDAKVAVGLKPGLTLDQIRTQALDGTLEVSLNYLSITPGELVLVDAGTVHAILPGSVLLEVQENCDLTYRLFDYGRPRPLSLDKSLEALKFSTSAGKIPPQKLADRTLLLSTSFFTIESFTTTNSLSSQSLALTPQQTNPDPTLSYLFVVSGSATVLSSSNDSSFTPIELPERSILAIPASSPDFIIQPHSALKFLRICAPK